ncbi:MAG TPA: protein-L-isoaspartate O-methyltransferase [Gammaproteobacteria bacterium]|jgi:protein-L-isoaspartate(D-aspartate) O-methyltransferase
MDTQDARTQMVQQQIRAWHVLDLGVLAVFEALPRDKFVPEAYRGVAYADTPIPLPHGEYMWIPTVEGRVLQALDVKLTDTVLEIGTGAGYFAACLAKRAREVHSVDIHPDFIEGAGKTLKALGFKNVKLETRDGTRLDWLEQRYDVIVVTGSLPVFQQPYAERLNVGGRLFVIVGQSPVMEGLLITRTAEDAWSRASLFETDVPALKNAAEPSRFKF